jgi:hypothetical protein
MRISEGKIAIIGLLGLAVWLYVALPLFYLAWPAVAEKPTETVLGLGNLGWTAVGASASIIYDLLTVGILFFAYIQVSAARTEARISRTLAACDRYDTDPVLDQVTRRLSEDFTDGKIAAAPEKYRVDLHSIFNYFESIAIGVSRKLYDEPIVKDHLESIIRDYVRDFVRTGITERVGIKIGERAEEDFNTLAALCKKWGMPPFTS